jgi:hypothetical protein
MDRLPEKGNHDADTWAWLWSGAWLRFLPERFQQPTAWCLLLGGMASIISGLVAPIIDARGEAWLEAAFTRTLAALAASRALDSAISLAQSSEVSFSFGPGGSLGIGQALDPVNDLVEQYGGLLLTSTTALGIQRLGMQIGQALGLWLFLPAVAASATAIGCRGDSRTWLLQWARRLFLIALLGRLAIPATAWVDAVIADRFLETTYLQAEAAVEATTQQIEAAGNAEHPKKPWYERYNPIDAVGERARLMYAMLAEVGESLVNLVIYFTISTIVLPLATLWLLSRLMTIL